MDAGEGVVLNVIMPSISVSYCQNAIHLCYVYAGYIQSLRIQEADDKKSN